MVFEGVASMLRPGGVFARTTPTPAMSFNAWDYPASLQPRTQEASPPGRFQNSRRGSASSGTAFDPGSAVDSKRCFDLRFARHAIRRRFLLRGTPSMRGRVSAHRDLSAALVKTRRRDSLRVLVLPAKPFPVSMRCSRVSSRNDCRRVVTMSDGRRWRHREVRPVRSSGAGVVDVVRGTTGRPWSSVSATCWVLLRASRIIEHGRRRRRRPGLDQTLRPCTRHATDTGSAFVDQFRSRSPKLH